MSLKILVADDSLYARMLIKKAVAEFLPDADYIDAVSGEQVLTHFGNDPAIDYFLLDVNMGAPDGYDTAVALIERGVSVRKISLVTGNKSSELQEKANALELSYINKSISPADLDGFIQRLKDFFAIKES